MKPNQPGPADPASLDPAPQAIPSAVDQYRLLRALGWGGTGIVCEAVDSSHGRRVAIKLIRGVAPPPVWCAELQHPHVVSVFDTGIYSGGVYLVMELVSGPSVQSLLGKGPLTWSKATAMLTAACEGVMAVHAHGIVHRDIKPANLLRSADGVVKLTDFGLACRLHRQESRTELAGTPHYMSPEQCQAEECDERSDIYSLGATYHTLLAGQTPYADAIPLQILFAHCAAPVPDPRRFQRKIPRACAEIVMRAMAKKRADRFDSAREMRNALRRVLLGG